MLSIAIKDMFFNTVEKPNKRDIETMYRELCDMFRQKHEQHMNSEQRVVKLNQDLRDSAEESRQLMLKIARNSNKETKLKDAHQEELENLQSSVADLNSKNKDLEKRLVDMSDHINASIASKSLELHSVDETNAESVSQLISQSDTAEVIDLTFTPQFQAILEKHAEKCHS